MKNYVLSLAIFASSLTAHNALAIDMQHAEHLTFSAGVAEVGRSNTRGQFSVDYKSEALLQDTWDSFMPFTIHTRPMAGLSTTSDSARYIYGGVAIDVPLSERWNLATHVVAGLYSKGAGRDLGGAFEFREGIGAEYMFDNGARAGFSFNHHSNAFIYDENPGSESLLVNYSHPVDFITH